MRGHDIPYIEVSQSGTTYRLPVQVRERRGGEWEPVPVARSPKLAFPPPIAIAGPEGGQFRRNYDVDEMVLTDWSRGIGVDIYPPNAPPSGVQYGDLDSRNPAYLVPPPLVTSLGTVASTSTIKRVLYPQYTDARLLTWASGAGAFRYDPSPAGWNAVQSGGNDLSWFDATEGLGFTWAAGLQAGPTYKVYRSSNGTAWDGMAIGAITNPYRIAIFDERVWVLDRAAGLATIYSSVDLPTAAAGAGTWTAGNTFRTTGVEDVARLFVWMYPLERGKATLWCLTTARLLYYDYYAATPSWKEFYRFRNPNVTFSVSNVSDAHVWAKNGNLYTGCSYDEFITEFTGNTVRTIRLNNGGGLPSDRRLAPSLLAGDDDFLYVFCAQTATDASAAGAVVAMTEGGAFQPIYRPSTSGHLIGGGGVGANRLWVARYETVGPTLRMLELDTTDGTLAPHLTAARSYEDGAFADVTGWLHANLLNVNKRLLYFEVDALKASDGSPGLDTGCTIQIEYRKRGAAFVSAGTLTSASTFPAVLAISGGYTFKELQVRVTLDRGTTSTQAPIIRALKLGYRPRPKQRYTYQARVDLRDGSPAFQTDDETFWGYSASKLREVLDEMADHDDAGQDDTLVALAYGGHGNLLHPRRRSVAQAEVSIQAQENVDGGDGLYLLVFSQLDAPSSG